MNLNSADFTLRIMTYNIHSCVNVYGREDADTIARVIAEGEPDVIALQEVESQTARPDGLHQSRFLAERLSLDHRFFPLRNGHWGKFGLAVLARFPISIVKTGWLPEHNGRKPHQPRGAMWMKMETPHGPVNIVNTHLSLFRRDRILQVKELLGSKWIGGIPEGEPVIVCGDFNAGARSPVYQRLSTELSDVQTAVSQKGYPKATFFSFYPMLRIDHIFVSRELSPVRVSVPISAASRTASDHLPLMAELALAGKSAVSIDSWPPERLAATP